MFELADQFLYPGSQEPTLKILVSVPLSKWVLRLNKALVAEIHPIYKPRLLQKKRKGQYNFVRNLVACKPRENTSTERHNVD